MRWRRRFSDAPGKPPPGPVDRLVKALAGAGSDLRRELVQRQAGDRLTPLEVAELAGRPLPEASAEWLGRIAALTGLGRVEPAGFERRVIQPTVEIYGDPRFPSRDKSLVIGFTGQLNRLMMPLAAFLQALPAERCDLVVVRKGREDHYDRGIPPWTGMTEAAGALLREAGAARYRRLATFGVSAGGLPALRYGILGGAGRAVSVGGRFHWHVHRLRTGGEVPAVDPLCACMTSRWPELVCV